MTPKEKANELVDKFYPRATSYSLDRKNQQENAKQCAFIAVDEIMSLMIKFHNRHIEDNSNEIYFWELVKEEIEKI